MYPYPQSLNSLALQQNQTCILSSMSIWEEKYIWICEFNDCSTYIVHWRSLKVRITPMVHCKMILLIIGFQSLLVTHNVHTYPSPTNYWGRNNPLKCPWPWNLASREGFRGFWRWDEHEVLAQKTLKADHWENHFTVNHRSCSNLKASSTSAMRRFWTQRGM